MAKGTALLYDGLGGMHIVKIRRMMIRRLETGPFRIVAFGATERRVDLAVTNQTVSHLRHIGRGDMVRGIDATMACQARIRRVQMSTNVIRIGQIRFLIDCRRDHRRDVSELQVLRVAELRKRRSAWISNVPARVARFARRGGREQVVRRRRALSGVHMAIGTLPPKLQMQLMRKLLTRGRTGD